MSVLTKQYPPAQIAGGVYVNGEYKVEEVPDEGVVTVTNGTCRPGGYRPTLTIHADRSDQPVIIGVPKGVQLAIASL